MESGKEFNSGLYDESYDIFKLKEMGLPFAMACFEIDTNEFILIGMDRDDQTPRGFIEENHNNNFVLDHFKPSRTIKTMFGLKRVHYAKHAK
jgi:hypothetical protein